ncbi:MAG: RpiB/LacA/LacB family sugar-phosphate isomerase [Dehalococcoidia bacterium]
MRIAFGSDEKSHLTEYIERELRQRGHEVESFGPPGGQPREWVDVARAVAERVGDGEADWGVLCCWTGTGVSIAANKVAGVRAALCGDAQTARGARAWNDANLLCLSLRTTTEALAGEIIEAWLSAAPDPTEAANVDKLKDLDGRIRSRAQGAPVGGGER